MSLQTELAEALGATPRIRWGAPGQLDVLVDGKLVFSKKAAKRMSEPGEVARLANARR